MNTYHIIDHEGFGTIHRLLIPLCEKYQDHHLFTTGKEHFPLTERAVKDILQDPAPYIIVHSTGKMKSDLLTNFRKQFEKIPASLFLHTSYHYQELKGRGDMIHDLLRLTKEYEMNVFLPSKEVAVQYGDFGIPVRTVQLGIPPVYANESYFENRPELEPYYNKIITTCCSSQPIYGFVKGLDLFEELIGRLHLQDQALIAGIDGPDRSEIPCKKFSTDDFLNILCHAKAYVQLSRYETYNLTAVQAKQFMVPTLVLGVEGAQSCMGEYAYAALEELASALEHVLDGQTNPSDLICCWLDSRWRESMQQFYDSLAAACTKPYDSAVNI